MAWEPTAEKLYKVEEFRELELPQTQWLLPKLLPGSGWTVIIAPPKTGKSLLSIQICNALAMGQPFLECVPERAYKVLYVQADAPPKNWQKQLTQYGATGWYTVVPPARFFSSKKSQEDFAKLVQKGAPWDFLIWDALESVLKVDSNEQTAVGDAIEAMKKVHREPFAVIHHPRKGRGEDGEDDDPRDAISGSKYLASNPNAILQLKAKMREKHGVLTIMADREETLDWPLKRLEHGFWERDHNSPARKTARGGQREWKEAQDFDKVIRGE